jgi:hypothetical protein
MFGPAHGALSLQSYIFLRSKLLLLLLVLRHTFELHQRLLLSRV